jgi:hypothetical protein
MLLRKSEMHMCPGLGKTEVGRDETRSLFDGVDEMTFFVTLGAH